MKGIVVMEVASMMKAVMRVAQAKLVVGCSWRKTMG